MSVQLHPDIETLDKESLCYSIYAQLYHNFFNAQQKKDDEHPYGIEEGDEMCFDGLCREVVSVSAERLSDFCICQTYAISGYDTAYRRKWNVSHSFGKKAIGRYLRSGKERRYREDRWLKSFGLSRHDLARAVEDRRSHPFGRFIYPEYEETTKRRLLSTEAGYLVCALSTLMWTPFSPSCSKCAKAEPCRRRTQARYPELYRIRCEAWRKKEAKP